MCPYCQLLHQLEDRRFYLDSPDFPFIIIENFRTLCPMVVYKNHVVRPPSLDEFLSVYVEMHRICRQIFGANRYYLREDRTREHFCIVSSPLITFSESHATRNNNDVDIGCEQAVCFSQEIGMS